jgi:two-component system, NarL family, response regulator DevR
MTIRVLIVDDHPVVLEGLGNALRSQQGIEVVAIAQTIEEATAAIARQQIDVGLVDVRLPDGLGLDLIAATRADGSAPAWIVLSTYEFDEYVAAALEQGASGYLLKTAPLAEIVDAIRQVAAGGSAYEARHLSTIMKGRVHLSPRERQVIAGVVASRSNDEIAGDLGVSRKTVEAYLTRLFDRLAVASRVELALKAEREAWLAIPTSLADGGRPRGTSVRRG